MAFLRNMTDDQKRAALAAIPQARTQQLIGRCYHGTNVTGLSLDAAMVQTRTDFTAHRTPIQTATGHPIVGHVAVTRSDDGAPIAVVSRTFGVVDHHRAVRPLAPVLDRGDAALVAIDSRDGGARFEATAILGFSAVQRAGIDRPDGLAHFLRVSNAHDGSANVSLALSTFRLACDNGMGFTEVHHKERVRHTRNADLAMVDFGSGLDSLLGIAEQEVTTFQQLADAAMTPTEFVEFAETWLLETRGEPTTEKQRENMVDDAADLLRLFQTGTANLGRDRYDALNAITEWLTPRREAYKDAARYASAFYQAETGNRARNRQRALRLLAR